MNNNATTFRQTSILDVAERAGVSPKTVSNVLTGRNKVRESTKERVLVAINELHYHPNGVSRQLRYGRTRTIMLAVPELVTPYFALLAHKMLTLAHNRGYSLLITETLGEQVREAEALRGLDTSIVDGVIVSTVALSGGQAWKDRSGLPVVLLGERSEESPLCHVIIDNRESGKVATEHLLNKGCRKIAFMGVQQGEKYGTGWLRMLGYRDALLKTLQGFTMDNVIETNGYTRQAGEDAAHEKVVGRDFDGLVCGNDMLAIGAIHEFIKSGVGVPNDIRVLGWDNTDEGKYSNPSLTSISQDMDQLVELALNSIISCIEDGIQPQNALKVNYQIIQRDSTR